jgi:O-antigen/teichoic acid export membrane protein
MRLLSKQKLVELYGDSLYRNSLYLLLATVVLSGFGFFFWLISAHLIPTSEIGLATTLVSVMNMISVLSLLGFDTSLIRFLAKSENRNERINTSMTIVALGAGVLAILFIVLVRFVAPQLIFVRATPLTALVFVLFCMSASLNVLTDTIFLAYRQTKFSLVIDAIFSVVKIVLPFFFFPFGAFGIFSASALSQTIGFVLSIAALMWKFDLHPRFSLRLDVVRTLWSYSIGNYASGVLNILPTTLLPIIITDTLGPTSAAYFYIVMMIGGLLYVIPASVTRALFAEGAYDEASFADNALKSTRAIAFLLLPAIVVLCLVGKYVLGIFGADYADNGIDLLYLVALAGLAVSGFSIFSSFFRINRDVSAMIITNILLAGVVFVLTFALLPLRLTGIGIAWLLGNAAACALSFAIYYRTMRSGSTKSIYARIVEKLQDYTIDLTAFITFKRAYRRAKPKDGIRSAVLFYPDKPHLFHMTYRICHLRGYRMTNDPTQKTIASFYWEDVTTRDHTKLPEMSPRHLVNVACTDVSKVHVEKVFKEVFGYGMEIDPRVHHGVCVKKSNENAVHDGKIVTCPCDPEEGYVYQKLINNIHGDDSVYDIRVPIFGHRMPLVMLRYRSRHDRFDNTKIVDPAAIDGVLSDAEQKNILRFCEKLGLEYGELDILRDRDDGLIYIVDANSNCSGPLPGIHMSNATYEKLLRTYCDEFDAAFVSRA